MYFSQYVNRSCLRAAVTCKSIVDFTQAFKGHQPERETLGDETRKERKKKKPTNHQHGRQAMALRNCPFVFLYQKTLFPVLCWGSLYPWTFSPCRQFGFLSHLSLPASFSLLWQHVWNSHLRKGKWIGVHSFRHFSPWPVVFLLIGGWQWGSIW